MLHKSFKPAKCKTALKLATSRIKLLKNKRLEQVKHLKRDLAQLLESGQDQTARIRVEHVVREEKTVAAYDLIEIYSELIVARLPIIESQKNCPIDLKEAIASVIFAAPRCADLPELMDVRKHFTAKYGKEFVSAAIELRPECGVSRLLVEKLSAKAPDGPTKIKILSAIAEEHNIKWDPESFSEKESKPPDDLLNGPNTFEKASRVPVNPPYGQASLSLDDKGPPNVEVPYNSVQRNGVPKSFDEQKATSSPHFDYSNVANKGMSSGTPQTDVRPSGAGVQGMEFRDSYSADGSTFSPGRQNWNMEFKDATAAAQAAAESAERASMAARAAAELSSRGNISRQYSTESHKYSTHSMRDEAPQKYADSTSQNFKATELSSHGNIPTQYSTESHKSSTYGMRDEGPKTYVSSTSQNFQDAELSSHGNIYRQYSTESHESSTYRARDEATQFYAGSTFQREHLTGDPVNILRHGSNSGIHHEWTDTEGTKQDYHGGVGNFYNSSGSFKSSAASFSGAPSANEHEKADLYYQRNSSEKWKTEHLGVSEVQFVNELHDSENSENVDYHEVRIRKQSSHASSRSHSSSFIDDHNAVSNLNGQESGPFVNDKSSFGRNTKETHSYDNASVVFDDSGSDNDGNNFDLEDDHKKHEHSLGFSSVVQQSSSQLSTNANSWSVRQNVESPRKSQNIQSHIFMEQNSAPIFSESLTRSPVPSQAGDLSVTFDNSDGPSSEGEEELEKPKLVGSVDLNKFTHEGSVDSHEAKKDISSKQFVEAMADIDPLEEPSLESGNELKFGNLTGGLRNKGYRRPPYSRIDQGSASSSREAAQDTSSMIEQSSPAVDFPVSLGSHSQQAYDGKDSAEENRRASTRASAAHDVSSDGDPDELPKQAFGSSTLEKYNNKEGILGNKNSSSRVSVPIFGSGNSDSEEDFPKRTSMSHSRNKGFSRRTKVSLPNTESRSNVKTSVFSAASVTRDSAEDYNSSMRPSVTQNSAEHYNSSSRPSVTRNSAEDYNSSLRPSVTRNSADENYSSSSSHAAQPLPQTRPQKRDSDQGQNYDQHGRMEQAATKPVSNTRKSSLDGSLRSSEKHKPSLSDSSESLKTSSGEGSFKEKPSHVHPKLPDVDTFTALFQALRKNRQ
ncbi:hypothetical protein SLE2022_161440 [Rubroshorea leprosula]